MPASHHVPPAAHQATPSSRPSHGAPSHSGPDLGYAIACVGLLLTAALLGLSEDGRQATRPSQGRIVSALRPLLGRRS
jgi:hypothetical protein